MRQLFVVTGIMSTIAGIFGQVTDGMWWVGIIAFLWLCGANWIFNLLRHGLLATELSEEIDELICGKIEVIEHEKNPGKLKSWF